MLTREKLNSRKLFMSFWTENLAAILLVAGQLDGQQFVTITLAVVGAYLASQGYVDGKTP